MTEEQDGYIPTAEEQTDSPTSDVHIELVLHALRTRQPGHLAGAIELIEALRNERSRRRTAMNVLALVVSLGLDDDEGAKRARNPMRRAMLESALERAVLAQYPEDIEERIARARAAGAEPTRLVPAGADVSQPRSTDVRAVPAAQAAEPAGAAVPVADGPAEGEAGTDHPGEAGAGPSGGDRDAGVRPEDDPSDPERSDDQAGD